MSVLTSFFPWLQRGATPSSNWTIASCSLFILKILYNCVTVSILSEKEETLNEELEVGKWISDEAKAKLWNALKNKDLIAVSVAKAITETAHNKIKCAHTDMILNRKNKDLSRKKTFNNWHAKSGTFRQIDS